MRRIIVVLLFFTLTLWGCGDFKTSSKTALIDDVSQYSNISDTELKNKLGEPDSTEDWTNKTDKGNFQVTTISYTIDTKYYEFIIADGKVVRATIYSGDYWAGDGNVFEYSGNVNDIFDMFGIVPDDSARKKDIGSAYILKPVNNIISEVSIQNIDDGTFGMIKVTYNSRYFD